MGGKHNMRRGINRPSNRIFFIYSFHFHKIKVTTTYKIIHGSQVIIRVSTLYPHLSTSLSPLRRGLAPSDLQGQCSVPATASWDIAKTQIQGCIGLDILGLDEPIVNKTLLRVNKELCLQRALPSRYWKADPNGICPSLALSILCSRIPYLTLSA